MLWLTRKQTCPNTQNPLFVEQLVPPVDPQAVTENAMWVGIPVEPPEEEEDRPVNLIQRHRIKTFVILMCFAGAGILLPACAFFGCRAKL
jgi:hypothetical protein